MSRNIVIRVQSPNHGTRRIDAKPAEKIKDFLDKVQEEFKLPGVGWNIYLDREKCKELVSTKSKTLTTFKLKHGDMLYLSANTLDLDMTDSGEPSTSSKSLPQHSTLVTDSTPQFPSTSSKLTRQGPTSHVSIEEDEVDTILEKEDGRIERPKNDQLCRHGPSGKCFHCVPLEPYDEEYLKNADPPIKFLSFHSYIRKLTGGVDKGKFVNLENLSCKIKPGCTEHPPWPGGICTKCQPNAVTLNRQKYRHIDYTQFENPAMVERFLDYWRSTGNQRIGILYGRYEPHKDIPLGIKAVVAAIYEPPQIGSKSSVELLTDDKENRVNHLARQLGIYPVGWIFTDLVALDLTKGTVKHFRGTIDSHFLSAEECIMAASFQNKYPNPCKRSPEGHFGSKFVTIVATGDNLNQIHFEAYQVSNQGMALVNDDCFIPTKDAPELGYVKESSNEQYVPDVFFKEKDEYGNEVTQLARPLPVEYLLLDSAVGFPVVPSSTFQSADPMNAFPVENRSELGDIQDFNSFTSYMQKYTPEKFLEAVSDFHLLCYMDSCEVLPLKGQMAGLLDAVKKQDPDNARQWCKEECWRTVEQLIQAHVPSPTISRQTSYVGPGASPLPPIGNTAGGLWTCNHCTFLNNLDRTACEMCGLPK